MRILVLEDDLNLLEIFSDYLSGIGFHVTPLSEGAQFVPTVLQSSFDLLICDLILPGFNFAKEINAIEKLKKPPGIIIMSGDFDEATKFVGQYRVLAKPFELDTMKKTIHEALSRREQLL